MSHLTTAARTTAARAAVALSTAALLGLGGGSAAHATQSSLTAGAGHLPQCTNAELTAHYRGDGAGMSHQFGKLVLTNTSHTVCRTGGYGGLSYVGHGDGAQIGAAATRDADGVRVHPIVVEPGQHVTSEIAAADAEVYPRHRCRPTHVDGFRVYLPDETRSQFVEHPTLGCADPHVDLLSHQAYS